MKNKDLIQVLCYTDNPLDLYRITNEYELMDSIEHIERYFRSSREYKGWVQWKKYKHEQTICKALNIDTKDYDLLRIEQDHYPISLWQIVFIIGNKLLSELKEDEYLTTFDIVSEVLKEHLLENNIGSVSLLLSYHELRHEGLFIPELKSINGNYKTFITKYKEYIPEHIMKQINSNLEQST